MQRGARRELLRRAVAWSATWLVSGALYLLLIDITTLPELLVGVVAAALAATGLELAREQQLVGESARVEWLARLLAPLAAVPADVAFVCLAAVRQLVRRERTCGAFRSVPFGAVGESPLAG